MIDYLRHVAVFAAVAKNNSFSQAARSLGIAPSRVSESISKLEHYVGATLFNRTTRKIMLTNEGRKLYEHTSDVLESAERGLNLLRETKSAPIGTLRMSMPSYLSSSPLAWAIGQFVALHPKMHVTVDFTDHDVEPVDGKYDMCIRSGKFDKRPYRICRLGQIERAIFAGKGYLAGRKAPDHPKDLIAWDWINYRHSKRFFDLKFKDGQAVRLSIKDQARLQVDTLDALFSFVRMNFGVAVMPVNLTERAYRENKLIRLFSDWHLPAAPYFAVWPDKSGRESLVSIFVEFLENQLKRAAT